MATIKKVTSNKRQVTREKADKTELKVSTPKKLASSKKVSEMEMSEVSLGDRVPRSRIFTKKYLYAVLIVLAIIGVLFTVSRFWIVAWVDNKPITKFELYSLLEKRDDGKTTEELIVQRLLMSEGKKQNQSVNNSEVETEVKKIEDQQGGAAQLDQILTMQKLSREDFRKLVQLQLLKQKLFSNGVNISEADINKYIQDNKDSIPPDLMKNPESSETAKLRSSVKEQLKQTKVNDNFNNWLTKTLKGPRVIHS